MTKPRHFHPTDFHGAARLAADATSAVTDVVQAMHEAIVWPPFLAPLRPGGRTLPGLVYSGIRGVAQLVGSGVDVLAPPIVSLFGEQTSTPEREALISVLNGVVGDHLEQSGNPLALEMVLRRRGRVLALDRELLAAALPSVSPRIALFVHGLCGSDAQWKNAAVDYGALVEADAGFTPVYLRYNSGRHVSSNGRDLACLLENLVREWPLEVEELLIVGHSMGGLLARSAVHHANATGAAWTSRLTRMAFLGTPHHGAPLERGGNWLEEVLGSLPYAAPLSRLGRLRSAGITDLRHGNLLDSDWEGGNRFARGGDPRSPLPLPADVDCLAVAATTGRRAGDARDRLVGDGLVPIDSALGRHRDADRDLAFPESHCELVVGTGHMGLLGNEKVWERMSRWIDERDHPPRAKSANGKRRAAKSSAAEKR